MRFAQETAKTEGTVGNAEFTFLLVLYIFLA